MKRRTLLILLFLIVAGGGLFVWNASRDAQARTFLLADGSQLTFRGITVGTNHSYSFATPLQRIGALVPGKLGAEIHQKTLVNVPAYSATNVVFWFHIRKNPALASFVYIHRRPDGGGRALYRMQPLDVAENRPLDPVLTGRWTLPSGELGVYWLVPNLPPTLRTVRLKLSTWRGPEDQHESVEFTAPNPLYRKQP